MNHCGGSSELFCYLQYSILNETVIFISHAYFLEITETMSKRTHFRICRFKEQNVLLIPLKVCEKTSLDSIVLLIHLLRWYFKGNTKCLFSSTFIVNQSYRTHKSVDNNFSIVPLGQFTKKTKFYLSK